MRTKQIDRRLWRPWFAWRPVRLDYGQGALVWLETIDRCDIWHAADRERFWKSVYRDLVVDE